VQVEKKILQSEGFLLPRVPRKQSIVLMNFPTEIPLQFLLSPALLEKTTLNFSNSSNLRIGCNLFYLEAHGLTNQIQMENAPHAHGSWKPGIEILNNEMLVEWW
jgi:hypothetical protein